MQQSSYLNNMSIWLVLGVAVLYESHWNLGFINVDQQTGNRLKYQYFERESVPFYKRQARF